MKKHSKRLKVVLYLNLEPFKLKMMVFFTK